MQEPANIMHIQICDQANLNFSVKISGINIVGFYDTGTEMSFMFYASCYLKLKDPSSLKILSSMSVHSGTGCNLYPVGLVCCEVTIGKLQFRHTFFVCKKLQKELVIDLDMQHLHHILGCYLCL